MSAAVSAQDIQTRVTYVCSGARLYVENCNIRDTSDNANCMVDHPDEKGPNGQMKVTYETRGNLKKLLPTCQQPSAKSVQNAQAADQKAAAAQKAAIQPAAPPQPTKVIPTDPGFDFEKGFQMPTNSEMRAMYRCIEAGRLQSVCMGNALQNDLFSMVGSTITTLVPGVGASASAGPVAGPQMAGAFFGNGGWRMEFSEDAVGINCADMSVGSQKYTIRFVNNQAVITTPASQGAFQLLIAPDGTLVGSGPVTFEGLVGKGVTEKTTSKGTVDVYHEQAVQRTCVKPVLSSRGAGVGVIGTEETILENAFGGESAPAPPGLRMTGVYAASNTGFSLDFHPESVIVGCGPEVGHAYPYSVVADGKEVAVKVQAGSHPLSLAIKSNNTLDPGGATAYEVDGRRITGKDASGNLTFSLMDATCNLALLSPGPVPSTPVATTGGRGGNMAPAVAPVSRNGAPPLSTSSAPTGNAILTITSGLPALAAPRGQNPLAGQPYVILRDDLTTVVGKSGITVPQGSSGIKTMNAACANNASLECQKILAYLHAENASYAQADFAGKAALPGVPSGTYYLMVSVKYNNQLLFWGMKVDLQSGQNSVTLTQQNATPVN